MLGGDFGSMVGCTVSCYLIRCLLLFRILDLSCVVVNSVVVFSFFKLWFCVILFIGYGVLVEFW